MTTSLRGVEVVDLAAHPDTFVTVRSVAAYWGVHVQTVRRDIRKGALPVFRLPGGAIRIRTADALAYGEPEG
jgi:excisionase family DNA binding protein